MRSAFFQQRAERVEVPHVVSGPILQPRVHNFELKREDTREHPLAGGGRLDRIEDDEKVRALRGGLVEEA